MKYYWILFILGFAVPVSYDLSPGTVAGITTGVALAASYFLGRASKE